MLNIPNELFIYLIKLHNFISKFKSKYLHESINIDSNSLLHINSKSPSLCLIVFIFIFIFIKTCSTWGILYWVYFNNLYRKTRACYALKQCDVNVHQCYYGYRKTNIVFLCWYCLDFFFFFCESTALTCPYPSSLLLEGFRVGVLVEVEGNMCKSI